MRYLLSALLSLTTVRSSSPTYAVICKGSFAVRSSACNAIPSSKSDVVPTETMTCTNPMDPKVLSSVISGAPSPGRNTGLDFSSSSALSSSLVRFPTPFGIQVIYGDCSKSTNLPNLAQETDYLAIFTLDNAAADASLNLNTAANYDSSVITMLADIRYYPFSALLDEHHRSSIAQGLQTCSFSNTYCMLPYESLIPSKQGIVTMNSYLSD